MAVTQQGSKVLTGFCRTKSLFSSQVYFGGTPRILNPERWRTSPIREESSFISLMAVKSQDYPRNGQETKVGGQALVLGFWGSIRHKSYMWNSKVTYVISALWIEIKENVEFAWFSLGYPLVVNFLSILRNLGNLSNGPKDRYLKYEPVLMSNVNPSHTI